jgi:hypothetical protein
LSSDVLFALEIAVYVFSFALTFVSGYLVYRQRLTSFHIVREFVLGVYFLIVVLMSLDFFRVLGGAPGFMVVYPALSTTLGLAQAILLLAAAVAVYLSPTNPGFRAFPSILRKSLLHASIFALFIVITIAALIFEIIIAPPRTLSATDLAGRSIPAMSVSSNSIIFIILLLGFFLGYPVLLLILAARKVQIPLFRRGLIALPIGWGLVSTVYVVIESYLWIYGVDATAVLYSVNAVIFFFATREFRNSAVLGGMVDSQASSQKIPPRFSIQVGRQAGFLGGTASLFEASATSSYELTLRDLAYEFLSLKDAVFVVTSKGSRLYQATADLEQIKVLAFSSNVSYLVPTKKVGEILIPLHDLPLLLDTMYKAAKSSQSNVVFIIDSLSDMILNVGLKETYQFVKQTLESFSDSRITLIAVIFQNAHETSVMNSMRSLFSNHVSVDLGKGLKVSKFQDAHNFEHDKDSVRRDLI